jgi:hypothetical protein
MTPQNSFLTESLITTKSLKKFCKKNFEKLAKNFFQTVPPLIAKKIIKAMFIFDLNDRKNPVSFWLIPKKDIIDARLNGFSDGQVAYNGGSFRGNTQKILVLFKEKKRGVPSVVFTHKGDNLYLSFSKRKYIRRRKSK